MNQSVFKTRYEGFRRYLQEQERSQATIEKYLRDVRSFAEYCGTAEIEKGKVIEYKQRLQDEGYAIASINSMLAGLNCFLRFIGRPECCVRQLRMQRQLYCPVEKELSKTDYFRLLETAKQKGNQRLYTILQTICGTGIRVSELRFFTVEAVQMGRITVQCKNKTRIVLLPHKLRRQLQAYAVRLGIQTGPLFRTRSGKPLDRSNLWTEMKKLCRAARVSEKKVFPHNLRKLFARTFYSADKDMAKLADVLGHSNINTTRIYIAETGLEHLERIDRLGLVVWSWESQRTT